MSRNHALERCLGAAGHQLLQLNGMAVGFFYSLFLIICRNERASERTQYKEGCFFGSWREGSPLFQA